MEEKIAEMERGNSIKPSSPVVSLIWSVMLFISNCVVDISRKNLSGEEKKKIVINQVKNFILSFNFNLPIPSFLLEYIISPVVEFVYQALKSQGLIN